MNIEMPQNGRLEFRLDSRDLSDLNITFDELDYSNADTRRVVWTLIDIARKNLHTDFDLTGRLLIEVYPEAKGGCRLCITTLPKLQKTITVTAKRDLTQHIFEFCFDDFLDFTKQIKKLPAKLDGELFSNGEKYRLIIPLSDNQHSLKALMYEYGVYKGCDEIALCYTREHWTKLKSVLG